MSKLTYALLALSFNSEKNRTIVLQARLLYQIARSSDLVKGLVCENILGLLRLGQRIDRNAWNCSQAYVDAWASLYA